MTVHPARPWLIVAVLLCGALLREALLSVALLCVALLCVALVPTAFAQEPDSIFQRFSTRREVAKSWQATVELPVFARPQVSPDARLVANDGINYVIAYRPENRVYFSRSYGYARLEWAPKDELKTAQAITLDVTEILNFSIARTFVMSFGLGLGLMHGLTVAHGGEFHARFEPFIPVQFGLTLPIGRSITVGAKVIQSSFFGPGPVISVLRGLIGFGYSY